MLTRNFGILALVSITFVAGCGKKDDSSTDIQEVGQQIGDVMSSIDESGGATGSFALLQEQGAQRMFARLENDSGRFAFQRWLEPEAFAATCGIATFSGCSNNVITRTFGGCTVWGATFNGTVTLGFNDAAVDNTCQMTLAGHSITRIPSFTVTGLRGAFLSVSKTGTVGQKVTKGGGSPDFTFSNDGIRRTFTSSSGTTLFDFTTQTTGDIQISGASRSNRVLIGGTLQVTNNLTGVSCSFSPSNVQWSATCNCAVSGSWSASCSDGNSASLTLTGCGTATLQLGGETESFTFDRCVGA